MPDLIRHPVPVWIPASAGMTKWMYFVAGVTTSLRGVPAGRDGAAIGLALASHPELAEGSHYTLGDPSILSGRCLASDCFFHL